MFKKLAKELLPQSVKDYYKAMEQKKLQKQIASLKPITEDDLRIIFVERLNLSSGDLVFVHSSLDKLNITFPIYNVLNILLEIIGENGTIAFPNYPPINSYLYLQKNEVFNIKRTPSFTGILSELARRHPKAIRSLHPIKSVSAIGPLAHELTFEHHKSPYPYDFCSPYYKISQHNAKIIGIGVRTTYLSAVHAVDDTLRTNFPVNPYQDELFEIKCIDYDKSEKIVKTYAHDMKKMDFDLPSFFKKNVDPIICKDVDVEGSKFFIADANKLYSKLCEFAESGFTIYSKKHYKK